MSVAQSVPGRLDSGRQGVGQMRPRKFPPSRPTAPPPLNRRGTLGRRVAWLIGLLIVVTPIVAHAQPWSGILDPSRAIDWTKAGIPGGIPNRTTICAALNPGATISQINSAIASCPSDQVVFLNAGTYTLLGGINFGGRSNVTL